MIRPVFVKGLLCVPSGERECGPECRRGDHLDDLRSPCILTQLRWEQGMWVFCHLASFSVSICEMWRIIVAVSWLPQESSELMPARLVPGHSKGSVNAGFILSISDTCGYLSPQSQPLA